MRRTDRKPFHTIAHIVPWPSVGGTEHATLRIAQAIDPARFRSIAFCLPRAAPVRSLFTAAGVPCATYEPAVHSYRHAAAYLRASWRFARELRRHQVDLVHCADLLAAYYAGLAAWLARRPVVSHIRGRFEHISWRDRSFLWPVQRFIFVSQNTWRRFGYRVPASRGTVVYDGIDVPPSGGSNGKRRSLSSELTIPETAALIGMVARVGPPKDFVTLAKAAARVLQVAPEVRFLIVGDYANTETHRAYYAEVVGVLEACRVRHAFIFTGYRQDVARILGALDIFVLSTHWEGLPLVILEAMAQARPVVATCVDGIPEIVRDGETGLLFPPQDDEALAAHVVALLRDRDRASQLGRAGQAVVQSEFTTARFGANMSAVYDQILNP